MPFYNEILNKMNASTRRRTTQRLLDLRVQIDRDIAPKSAATTLLATWNIREFDSKAYGSRLDEAILYISEIISAFDLVAIQEVRGDLGGLHRVMRVLGSRWSYIVSDVTLGRPGNDERMAFLYDNTKVRFGGLAGELVLPPIPVKQGNKTTYIPSEQVVRTPFLGGFKSGWTKFMLGTVHIYYGDAKPDEPKRVSEIRAVANHLKDRADDPDAWSANLVLLGDFNIFDRTDATYQALDDAGFSIPPRLRNLPGSNTKKDKFYDQIAFRSRPRFFDLADPAPGRANAGVFDFYQSVFRESDQNAYATQMGHAYLTNSRGDLRPETGRGSRRSYYRTYWRTHQMSDHLPLWTCLQSDFADEYLRRRAR